MSARTPARLTIDLVCLLGALLLALSPLLPVYGGTAAVPALVGGVLLGAAVSVVGGARGWSAPTVVSWLLGVFVVTGGALAAPATTIGGVVPTAATVTGLARGAASSWKQVLTLQPPIGTGGTLLVAAFLLALVGSATATALTVRARRPGVAASAAVVPVLAGAAAALLGTREPVVDPVVAGVVPAVLLLGWVSWRVGALRARRGAALAVVTVAAVAGGVLAGPVIVGDTPRFVLRDEITPPFDPRDFPSPLSAYRRYVQLDEDAVLFSVDGLPEGARVRLATMDAYDGVVWNVAGDGSAADSGEFRRVGAQIDSSAQGQEAQVTVEVGALSGVWLPTVGQATSVRIADAEATAGLRYNDATGAAVLTGGLQQGLRYTLDVVVPPVPTDEEIGSASAADVTLPAPQAVPEVVVTTAQDVAREAGSPVQIARVLADWLSQEGFYSDGSDHLSLSGHGADRMLTLLDGAAMIGDGEQYASAMALMAREMGLPARVVLGFVPPAGEGEGPVDVTGADVQAWVEIAFTGYGWVPFDATPPPEQTPQEDLEEQPTDPDPQVVQPPPPPPEAVTPPDEDTEQPQADEPARDEDGASTWLRVLRVTGMVGVPLLLLASPFLLVLVLKARRRLRRRRRPDPVSRVAGGWDEVLDAARDLRRPPRPLATRREAAGELAGAFGGADAQGAAVVAASVGALARSADRAVFAPGAPSAEQVAAYWTDVEAAVTAMHRAVPWRHRVRARVSTVSLRRRRRSDPSRRPDRAGRGAS
ncbi:transglutaminaseTgpA domain-containing protein [Cellulomonas soli]|uniref:transglutaminase family protein n=1 Tax=Cellulomonas soli TaxID=931535 RepID=UPI003F84674C